MGGVMHSRFSLIRKSIVTEVFGKKDIAFFWDMRFLPRWLPLVLGIGLGVFLSSLIVNQAWHFLVPMAFVIPAGILFSRYPFVAIMIWMLVFPFFIRTPTTAGRYIYWLLHRAMIPSALGYVILSHWLGVKKGAEMVPPGRAELAIVIFLGLALGNIILFNSAPGQQVYHLFDHLFVPFCAYWLIRLIAPQEEDLKRFLWVALFTIVAQCIIGLVSWFVPQVVPPQWLDTQGARTVGTFGNPAVYSTTLIFLSLLLFQYAMHCGPGRVRTVLLSVFALALLCVFFTFSRGSWLGALVVLMGLISLYPKVVIRLTIAVTVCAVLVYLISSNILASEVAFAGERLGYSNTVDARLVGNNASILMIEEKPWFGWGYGNYDFYNYQFKVRIFNIVAGNDGGATSHNTYLTVMAELGVIAFLVYVFPLGYWLGLSFKTWRRLPQDGFWSRNLLIMLWLLILDHIIVSNLMDMIRFNQFGTTVWWMAMGLVANMVYPYLRPGDIITNWMHQAIERA